MTDEWTGMMYLINDLIESATIERIKREYLETGTLLKSSEVYKEVGEQVLKGVKETMRDIGYETIHDIDEEIRAWGLEL